MDDVYRITDVITVVRRYDETAEVPASFGFHYFNLGGWQGYTETEPAALWSPQNTDRLLQEMADAGFVESTTPLKEYDEVMKRIVSRSCPIEFHRSLRYANGIRGTDKYGEIKDTVDIVGRIRVFTKGD